MKNSDIYIGTIKKCNDVYCYEKYGEERYVGSFKINNTELGEVHKYVDVITDQAILIKVNNEKYIWLNQIETFSDELLVNLGIAKKTINTQPSNDNDLFVEKNTLIPYFKNIENKNLNVAKLKTKILTDSRIKFGIEH